MGDFKNELMDLNFIDYIDQEFQIIKKKIYENSSCKIRSIITKMQANHGKQFHYFIQLSANRLKQAERFAEFEYMEYSIRKNYKQLKKVKIEKRLRPAQKFCEYFKNLQKQEQIKYYEKSLKLLEVAVKGEQLDPQKQPLQKQGQAYVKKTYLNKWQKKSIRLQNQTFYVQRSKKPKSYPLKFYQIRKSKNKQHYGWVLQAINDLQQKKMKSIHCGVRNVKDFECWFEIIEKSKNQARIKLYKDVVYRSENKEEVEKKKTTENFKTMTQMFIDNQMNLESDMEERFDDMAEQYITEKETVSFENQQKPPVHPNVFKRLFPHIDVLTFTQTALTSTLIQSDKNFRIVQLSPHHGDQFSLRINIMIPFNKSLVFRAITSEPNLWNNEIDVYSVKTKISSQNSALIYKKTKAQGLLYRQRDYLYFRHCFSMACQTQNQKKKIFIADKSIDSISYPPFMTVARGQKKVVYCIVGNPQDQESILIIEGQIKGGGYMNMANDKEMTIKFFKKFLCLQNYLKQKKFIQGQQKEKETIFQENWEVASLSQDEFYDISNKKEEVDSQDESQEDEKESKSFKYDKNRKFSSTSDNDPSQFDEFIKKTAQQLSCTSQKSQILSIPTKQQQLTFQKVYPYTPPLIAQNKTVFIPQSYLYTRIQQTPQAPQQLRLLFPHYRGHHLFKGQWAVCPTGGLNYIDEEKMNQQKKVLTYIIRRIGKNILSGKGVLNISLPVDIFCRESNIQRFAASFAFFPMLLEQVSAIQDPKQQLKSIIGSVHLGSLIYLTMQKPFNPILGQTYQSWIDGCPVYFQQISHHPPIAAYLMFGRGYRLSGTLEAKMDISINSGTGGNEGIFTVQFDNGRKFHYTTAGGEISGLTYGERRLLLVGKTYYWSVQEGLFLEITYNPSVQNRRFFGGPKAQSSGDSQFHDFFQGTLKKYKKEDLEEFLTPKKGDFRKLMAIPKSSPSVQPLSQLYKVTGRWTKYIAFNGEKMFDIDENRYCTMKDEENPLPSHSNYREDVVYRRMNNFLTSQEFKEVLQVKQRKDRKLREGANKGNHR